MSIRRSRKFLRSTIAAMAAVALSGQAQAQIPAESPRTRDRGPGNPTSMFGTYIERGELLVYPFFEYYRDGDAEYSPNEFGYGLDQDFRGRFRGQEWLLFLGYGISNRLAVEFEAAVAKARLERSPDDPTNMPAVLEESGLGDVEGQLRWLWNPAAGNGANVFSYFETVLPLQKHRQLIGTSDWEFKLGSGIVRSFGWGTATLRAAIEWDGEENRLAPGEYAIEYLRRISPAFRVYGGVEGSEDEVELITEAQWSLRRNLVLKLNNAFGLTSKAADWAPEVGLLWSFHP